MVLLSCSLACCEKRLFTRFPLDSDWLNCVPFVLGYISPSDCPFPVWAVKEVKLFNSAQNPIFVVPFGFLCIFFLPHALLLSICTAQIEPLVDPTRRIMQQSSVTYTWHEFFPHGKASMHHQKYTPRVVAIEVLVERSCTSGASILGLNISLCALSKFYCVVVM